LKKDGNKGTVSSVDRSLLVSLVALLLLAECPALGVQGQAPTRIMPVADIVDLAYPLEVVAEQSFNVTVQVFYPGGAPAGYVVVIRDLEEPSVPYYMEEHVKYGAQPGYTTHMFTLNAPSHLKVWRLTAETLTTPPLSMTFAVASSKEFTIRVVPAVKATSSISCSVSLPKVREGDSTAISGFLSPSRGGIPITLTYKKPDGSTYTKSIATSPEGRFADAYVPDMVGSWNVFASWSGDEGYLAATSPSVSFTVEAKPQPLMEHPNLELLSIIIAVIIVPAFILVLKRRKPAAAGAKGYPERVRARRFSKQLGLDHSQLRGKKILLEFDSSAPYERLIKDFGLECTSENETVIVLTRRGSIIQKVFEGEESVKLVNLAPQTMLTPILNEHPKSPLSLVYDNLTDLVLSVGPQAAYKFVQNMLELLSEPRITAIFLLNTAAHEPKDANSLRGLFGNQVVYGKQGITNLRFS